MCDFLSVIVLRSGDILHHPMLDSHTDIQRYFRKQPHLTHALRDEDRLERFARVEFTPTDETWFEPEKWVLQIDEDITPKWWDETMQNQTRKRLVHLVKTMTLVEGDHDLIVDGCWIVGGKAKVKDVRGGRIMTVRDSAQITNVRGSAQITNVWGSAQITDVRDWAQITNVRDSAQITNVRGSAQITDVWGSAKITGVGGSVTLDKSAKAAVKAGGAA